MVRAKFKVDLKQETVAGYLVTLNPVTSGSEENKMFYKYTPGGTLTLSTINKEVADQLLIGKEYYLDLTEAS